MRKRLNKIFESTRAIVSGTPAYVRTYQKLRQSLTKAAQPEFDLVYVMPPKGLQGWILDAICREIDTYWDASTRFVAFNEQLPPAKTYFYSHYGYMRDTVRQQPHVLHGKNLLFYTHPRDLWYPKEEMLYLMNMADSVISMCSLFVPDLIKQGVNADHIEVALVGADADVFQPHTRGSGSVGFCSSYLPRKGGDRILSLVKSMPHRGFTLCGRKWPEWERFAELNSLSNFKYMDIPYNQYTEFYDSIDVFVSMSELEGGPVPLIESAMCNAVPVCSNTGHAGDIITHGVNGFLFDISAPISEVSTLIDAAFALTCDVRSTVEHLTWKRFSQQIQRISAMRQKDPESNTVSTKVACHLFRNSMSLNPLRV